MTDIRATYLPNRGELLTPEQATELCLVHRPAVVRMIEDVSRQLVAAGYHVRPEPVIATPVSLLQHRAGWTDFDAVYLGLVSYEWSATIAYAAVAIMLHWPTDTLYRMDHYGALPMDPAMPEPMRSIELAERERWAAFGRNRIGGPSSTGSPSQQPEPGWVEQEPARRIAAVPDPRMR